MLGYFKNKHVYTALSVLSPIFVLGQNLVKNPSFEDFSDCPEELGLIAEILPYWTKPTEGTSDYFNLCSEELGIPKNFNGSQEVEFGAGYAGLYLWAPNNYREYLQAELTEPLEKGKDYEVSFYLSLAEKSDAAVCDMGLLFTEKKIQQDTRKVLVMPQNGKNGISYTYTEVKKRNFFADKEEWMKVEAVVTAKGGERFLIIGNFKEDSRTIKKQVQGEKNAAYYYLDMVSVAKVRRNGSYDDLVVDRTYQFDNVLFPNDVWALDEKAKEELNKLYAELVKKPTLHIRVHAHTDNVGSKSYNRELSTKRAREVAQYLTTLGLDKKRISWAGHGGDEPLVENTTEEGKMQNRRAEFTLSENYFDTRTTLTENVFEEDN